MPPILYPSPQILDQAFPRTSEELSIIIDALGEIALLMENGRTKLAITDLIKDIIGDEFIDWEKQPYPQIIFVRDFFQNLFLQPSESQIDLSEYFVYLVPVEEKDEHLLPEKCKGLIVDDLADELGKILVLHDQCIEKDEFFIGIACPYGFSGGELDTYDNPTDQRVFPLVGLETFEKFLVDADEWYIPIKMDISNKSVDINNLERNYSVIGISHIDSEKGRGSHRVLVIDGHRDISLPKPQRKGDKSVQDYVLKELAQTFNYSIDVIKYALIEGELPERRCKLERLKSKK